MIFNMKQFLFSLFLSLALGKASAQAAKPVDIIASISGKNLLITWNGASSIDASWEVQGSTDGKSYTNIGLVWGADPKGARGSYAFKQEVSKLPQQYNFYRVVSLDETQTVSSRSTRLSK